MTPDLPSPRERRRRRLTERPTIGPSGRPMIVVRCRHCGAKVAEVVSDRLRRGLRVKCKECKEFFEGYKS